MGLIMGMTWSTSPVLPEKNLCVESNNPPGPACVDAAFFHGAALPKGA
jgi:hypothetical protein